MNDEEKRSDTIFDKNEQVYKMSLSLSEKVVALKKKQLENFAKLMEDKK